MGIEIYFEREDIRTLSKDGNYIDGEDMNKIGMLKIQENEYGDIIYRVRDNETENYIQEITYNEHHEKILDIIKNRNGEITNIRRYEYEYDIYHNLVKTTIYSKRCGYEERISTYLCDNEYNAHDYLIKQTHKSENGQVYTVTKWYYSNNEVSKKKCI